MSDETGTDPTMTKADEQLADLRERLNNLQTVVTTLIREGQQAESALRAAEARLALAWERGRIAGVAQAREAVRLAEANHLGHDIDVTPAPPANPYEKD